jgi:hypothetical protein
MATLEVGPTAGGLRLGLGAASENADYYQATLVGPAVEWKIAQFFAGTPFENREDVEFGVRWELGWAGTPNSAQFEHRTIGFRANDNDSNRRMQLLQGGIPGNTVGRRSYTEAGGNLAYGVTSLTHSDLAYTPNVLEMLVTENYLRFSYSSTASSDIDDQLIAQYALERTNVVQRFVKVAGMTKEGVLFLAHGKNGGVAGLSEVSLKAMKIFARFSPRGLGTTVP